MAECSYSPNRLLNREWLAGRTRPWFSGDSKENFDTNFDQIPDYFKTAKISYSWNSEGYRTKYEFDELNPEQFVLCFGCSYTEGVGVGEHDTWPAKLEKIIKKPCVNMGISGGSSDVIVANSRLWMSNRYPKPHMVIIQIPETSREPKVFISNDRGGAQKFISNTVIYPSYDLEETHWNREKIVKKAWYEDIVTRHWETGNMLSAIAWAWRNWGVPVLFWTYDGDGDIVYNPEDVMRITGELTSLNNGEVDWARDLAHNGAVTSHNIAVMLENRYLEVEEWRNSNSMEPQPYSKNKILSGNEFVESWKDIQGKIKLHEIKGRRPFIYE